jgi:TrkA domain protein
VVSYRTGRRDLLLYDRDDPDATQEVIRLTQEEADTLDPKSSEDGTARHR